MYDEIKFAQRGPNVRLYPWIAFVNPENIHLNDEIIISEFCWIHGGIKTVVGNFIHIAYYSSIAGGGFCMLEDFVTLSAGARIITGSEMVKGEGLTNHVIPLEFRAVTRSFVHLQKHVFISSDVVVHPGVTVGEGAVIGSNSVVTRDIEPWTINMGSPARAVGVRPQEKIKRLENEIYKKKALPALDPREFLAFKVTRNFIPKDETHSTVQP